MSNSGTEHPLPARFLAGCLLILLHLAPLAAQTAGLNPDQQKQNQPFPPFRVIGNIYYVGTTGIAAFVIKTPEGNILIDSGYSATPPLIRQSLETLGVPLRDVKLLVSSHAHVDHVAGHAEIKEMTGAQILAPDGDADVIETGGKDPSRGRFDVIWKPVRVDRRFRDGEAISLGGVTLVPHITPGHTRGCTTWTTTVEEEGRKLNVVFVCSLSINEGVRLVRNPNYPNIADEYAKSFRILRSLPADVFLGPHGSFFGLEEKVKKLNAGVKPNPFIDPDGYRAYVDRVEKNYQDQLKREQAEK